MIDASTDLYCVIGNPVKHSKSPLIHNACFKSHGINAVYLAFEISGIEDAVRAIRQFNVKGVSVTLPFKSAIIPFLDEIDPDAQKIGAVNTVVNQNGLLTGYNTDFEAAVAPLRKMMALCGKTVYIIGAGGAAQAVAHGLSKEGARIRIVNRDAAKAQKLASQVNAEWYALKDIEHIDNQKIDVIINTTSVGMHPKVDAMPVPDSFLTPTMLAMDIIYTPLETKLLSTAKNMGCRTIDGLSMFIHQGAAQFKLWTGISPNTEHMKDMIIKGETS